MATPIPWSYTALDDFKNCPKAFYEKRVTKSVKEEQGPHLIWGRDVHKKFEDYVASSGKVDLPIDLHQHKPKLDALIADPGIAMVETRFAFDKKAKPCEFFYRDVWCRGVIDYYKVHGETAKLVDYKTGKPHSKFEQLALFALYIFAMYPHVNVVNVQFYWTTTNETTKKVYGRAEINDLWRIFIPDLKQYKEAFNTDTWQTRPSGLCNGWCPVTTCEHWKPKRPKR